MPLILGANSVSGYTVKNSLRFNSGSSDYLSKNSWATATSDKIFTYSTWVKRSQLANTERLFGAYAGSPQVYSCDLSFTSNNGYIEFTFGGASAYDIVTNAMFRDISAWYHVVLAVDTTQATSSNRIKIYVNDTLQTLQTANYPPQNTTYQVFRNNNANLIGSAWNGAAYYTGYMSETYFIDGQALTPSSFGETDEDSGIWKPKAYTGTFGTNGFYLDFEDSANLGNDMSGNNNDFTVNNLTSIDQTTDTPTNNFATMNPLLNRYSSGTGYLITFSEGNLKTTADNTSVYTNTGGTFQLTQGKWYWEAKNGGTGYTSFPTACSIGIHDLAAGFNGTAGTDTLVRGYNADGTKNSNDSTSSYGNSFVSGDIIMVALDLDNGKIWFGKNGTWQNSGSPTGGTNAAFTDLLSVSATGWSPWTQGYRGSSGVNVVFEWNFGNPPYSANSYADANGYGNFSYSVPSGYYALCTKNLYQYGF